MKKFRTLNILVILLATAIFASCTSGGGRKTETTDARDLQQKEFDREFAVNTAESQIKWEGYKPTGTHHGTISIKEGIIKMKNGNPVGGKFTIDINSIVVLDITDPGMNARLRNHLLSADFFEAETYPEAVFEITEIKPFEGGAINPQTEKGDLMPTHTISGNLTMKDVTKNITFNAFIRSEENSLMAQTNQFFLDRTDWNVRYGSRKLFAELKDNFINDEMGIVINLVAYPVTSTAQNK